MIYKSTVNAIRMCSVDRNRVLDEYKMFKVNFSYEE